MRCAVLGFLRGLCGDGERCAWQCEDHTFSQSSGQTYALGLLGFAAVVSDAALLERVVSMDTQDAPEGRYVAPAGGGGGGRARRRRHGRSRGWAGTSGMRPVRRAPDVCVYPLPRWTRECVTCGWCR